MGLLPSNLSNATEGQLTSHAMLVPWGLFGQEIGLVKRIMGVPIDQRTRDHLPQTKLLEFFVGHLEGCEYLQDISRGPHPLDQDVAVAQAWGQEGWADYSGVSRTLQACDPETVQAFEAALAEVSQPFIDREVMLTLRDRGVLVYDADLTGRPVSNTSMTYPNVAYGWMSDEVRLGYQAALVSMHSVTYGRLWLSVEQHPGDTVATSQLAAMIQAAESNTRTRPRRRTELLAQRITAQEASLHEAVAEAERAQGRVAQAQERLDQVAQERQAWAQEVASLEASYQAKDHLERPYSRLAKARSKLAVREQRLARRQKDLGQAQRRLQPYQAKVASLQSELRALQERLAQFEADNANAGYPIRAIFRLDAGFSSGANLALLIEMGYDVYTKAGNAQVVRARRRKVNATTRWTKVGQNAEMVAWENETVANCPYPLDVGLERFHTGNKVQHALLLHYGADRVTEDLRAWFAFYNGRQTIEAGIKEGKNVFEMHHLKVRSPAGLAVQERTAAFAANFVRWAAKWLQDTCRTGSALFQRVQASVKQSVRIAANTSAWVTWKPQGCLLRFTELSALAGTELLISGGGPFQLPLALFNSAAFAPT